MWAVCVRSVPRREEKENRARDLIDDVGHGNSRSAERREGARDACAWETSVGIFVGSSEVFAVRFCCQD